MSLSRRELLSALIGAPLAIQACQKAPREVPGRLVGANIGLGHRLLDATVERVSAPAEKVSVLIVGSGPSGLSAAWRLERAGIRDYRVLELESRPGGTSAAGTDGVVSYPWGAHYVPVPRPEHPELVRLLLELGAVELSSAGIPVGVESVRVRAPQERLFLDGRWVEGLYPASRATAADRAELQRFDLAIHELARFRDGRGRPAFRLPMRRSSDAAEIVELDRISAAEWLRRRGFRSALLRWYVEYACRDDYGASLERTSAWAMLFYFCARILDTQGETPFLTWPEGNGRIVQHLSQGLGSRLRLQHLVTDVVSRADGVELVAYDEREQRAVRYLAEDVVLALPKLVVQRILRPERDQASPDFSDFRYSAWLVANLHLSRRPRSKGFAAAWDNVLFDSPSLGYVIATHQTLVDFGPTVWTYYRPFWEHDEAQGRQVLRALDHSTAAAAVLADLGRAHQNLEACVERIDVCRWGHAMVTPAPGFIWGGAREKAAEPVGRVVFAHADLSGLPLLEEALDRGVLAAEAILRRRGREVPEPG